MPLVRRTALLLVGAFLLLGGTAYAAPTFPKQDRFVTDTANVVADWAETQLEARLEQYASSARKTILIATVPDLGGSNIEDYTNDLGDVWKPRHKDDPGVIVVIAMAERQMRIEVGTPLQGDLVDAEAARIIQDIMRPQMRSGDPGSAIAGAVEAIIGQLGGDTGQALAITEGRTSSGTSGLGAFMGGMFLLIALISVGGYFIGNRRTGGTSDWMWLPILLGSGNRDGGWSSSSGGGGFGGGGGGGGGFSSGGFGGGFSGGGASGGW